MNKRQKKKLKKRGYFFHYKDFDNAYIKYINSNNLTNSKRNKENYCAIKKCIIEILKTPKNDRNYIIFDSLGSHLLDNERECK